VPATSLNIFIIGGGMAGATAAKYFRCGPSAPRLAGQHDNHRQERQIRLQHHEQHGADGREDADQPHYTCEPKTKYRVVIKATVSSVDTANGWIYGKLNNTGSKRSSNATPFNRLILATGISFDYSPFRADALWRLYQSL